jgi:ornithine cyclodeaminase/alanine dehydrogenase
MTLLLSRTDVAALLTMDEAIATLELAFRELALGRVRMPQRTVIKIDEHHGTHLGMPACIGGSLSALALKVVTVYPDNPARGLPTTNGIVLLNDASTGLPLAVMDAGYLTAVRTGAASGVATKYLARADASAVGIFGAGVQARTQLRAMAAVRSIRSAAVFDTDLGRRQTFAREMSAALQIPVTAVGTAQEAVAGQDIVILASSAPTPVLDGRWLQPGQHLNAIGSHTPTTRELDTRSVARSRVFADSVEACLAEAGDLLIPIKEGAFGQDHIAAGLGDVVAGLKRGREHDDEITLFKSVGLALEDASTARFVYDKAVKAGAGTQFAF